MDFRPDSFDYHKLSKSLFSQFPLPKQNVVQNLGKKTQPEGRKQSDIWKEPVGMRTCLHDMEARAQDTEEMSKRGVEMGKRKRDFREIAKYC